ncbi:class I SAM-dependent methyltransferase [Pseudoxanthomonas suwonensis]|uniref:Methyltransferase domain-containing protein n=1 Tax=Pseudoxanthomonas suwonensis TaxID=314722 RepID=A0A0E3Z133_9GAMM|nr:methyltransferase domain-containing protein [Pseudoxanthomonas suwonensis]AKC86438.1 hypothetical protein WQ53_06315 [Pseudoxanthomonas suwonensis]
MDAEVQRRIQRYGWDRAAGSYEPSWRHQLSRAHAELLEMAAPAPGERVLDVACGTGLMTFAAAERVAPGGGGVIGIDVSGKMLEEAWLQAVGSGVDNAIFHRMDGESLAIPSGRMDLAICALGLMYMPDPRQCMHEMRRVLGEEGRVAIAVWGGRQNCGWSSVFPIVDAEVASQVCPLFFSLGESSALVALCEETGFVVRQERRVFTHLEYADPMDACNAVFEGGPVALAWSRFDYVTRKRLRQQYLREIEQWRDVDRYRIPAEFALVVADKRA